MKISAINFSIGYGSQIKKEQKQKTVQENVTNPMDLRSQFNDHLISFGARVDKGMNRFFYVNKDRMPERVRNLVEPMKNRELITPLDAQYYAYKNLEEAETVEDIKSAYPDERLFDNLKDVSQSKAKTGIIHTLNEMAELYPEGVLQTKDNMTVYLVKKIFLETKTIDEINKDLEEDLNEDFKVYYKGKNPDSPYIRTSTLNALGIKSPDSEYMQSLRYTRDGYSDLMGVKIKKGLNEFIASLTPEQRTARAVRSTREFENWWSMFTRDEKIEMIAKKEAEVEMLCAFKKDKRAEEKRLKEAGINIDSNNNNESPGQKAHTKVGSKELSRDELFKMWAGLNLKKFKESLSQAELDTFYLRLMANQFTRWKEMSAEERTDYISKMKAGAEPVRYSMIDAWNNSPEIIKALYLHLKENQVYKPADLLYSTEEFSQFQSKVMTEFWSNNPDFAQQLGDRINTSREKVEWAIKQGTFEALKQDINRNKNIRKKELEAYKKSLETPVEPKVMPQELDYKEEFRQAYNNNYLFSSIKKAIPKNYFDDVYGRGLDTLPERIVRLWSRHLSGDPSLTMDEILEARDFLASMDNSDKTITKCNNAFIAAMADSIYSATKNPVAYVLDPLKLKNVLYLLERGENPVVITLSDGSKRVFNVDSKHKRIDSARINHLYESYKRDLSPDELNDIVRYNFGFKVSGETEMERCIKGDALRIALLDYIRSYGRAINIIFSEKSAYPAEVKSAFAFKFFSEMPDSLKSNGVYSWYENDKCFVFDDTLRRTQAMFGDRFRFLPKDFVNSYFNELGSFLKLNSEDLGDVKMSISKIGRKRTNASETASVAVVPKSIIKNPYIKYQMLAMEQAMADVIFEAGNKNNDVYKICFEQLCDKLEIFSLVKKYPMNTSVPSPTVDLGKTELLLNKRINFTSIQHKYKAYMEQIDEWIDETEDLANPDYKELLYILNPEEGNGVKDFNTAERIATYFPDLSELDFSLGSDMPDFSIKFDQKNPKE